MVQQQDTMCTYRVHGGRRLLHQAVPAQENDPVEKEALRSLALIVGRRRCRMFRVHLLTYQDLWFVHAVYDASVQLDGTQQSKQPGDWYALMSCETHCRCKRVTYHRCTKIKG